MSNNRIAYTLGNELAQISYGVPTISFSSLAQTQSTLDSPVALTGEESPLSRCETAPVLQVRVPVMRAEDALLVEARNVLGYGKHLAPKDDKALYDVLAGLEVSIYDTDTMKAYQRWVLRKNGNVAFSRWERTRVADYKDPIPKDALSMAVAIKKGLPTAEIYVEHYKHDPFLRVIHNECAVYVAVWDEPDFDGKARIAGR